MRFGQWESVTRHGRMKKGEAEYLSPSLSISDSLSGTNSSCVSNNISIPPGQVSFFQVTLAPELLCSASQETCCCFLLLLILKGLTLHYYLSSYSNCEADFLHSIPHFKCSWEVYFLSLYIDEMVVCYLLMFKWQWSVV